MEVKSGVGSNAMNKRAILMRYMTHVPDSVDGVTKSNIMNFFTNYMNHCTNLIDCIAIYPELAVHIKSPNSQTLSEEDVLEWKDNEWFKKWLKCKLLKEMGNV